MIRRLIDRLHRALGRYLARTTGLDVTGSTTIGGRRYRIVRSHEDGFSMLLDHVERDR